MKELIKQLLGSVDLLMIMLSFVLLLIVQLKIIRMLRAHTSMMMFYGRQIEEIRKAVAEGAPTRRAADVSPEEAGLYEALKE